MNTSETRWYLAAEGQSFGPFDMARLADLAAEGRLTPDSFVMPASGGEWAPAAAVAALAGLFPQAGNSPAPATIAAIETAPAAPSTPSAPAPTYSLTSVPVIPRGGYAPGGTPEQVSQTAFEAAPPPVPAAPPAETWDQPSGAVPITGQGGTDRLLPVAEENIVVAKIVYGLYVAALIIDPLSIIGVITAYVHRGRTAGTWLGSHFQFQISNFWKMLGLTILGALIATFAGSVEATVVFILLVRVWFVVGAVRGWRLLTNNMAYSPGAGGL